jgi:hypothetical protein
MCYVWNGPEVPPHIPPHVDRTGGYMAAADNPAGAGFAQTNNAI